MNIVFAMNKQILVFTVVFRIKFFITRPYLFKISSDTGEEKAKVSLFPERSSSVLARSKTNILREEISGSSSFFTSFVGREGTYGSG